MGPPGQGVRPECSAPSDRSDVCRRRSPARGCRRRSAAGGPGRGAGRGRGRRRDHHDDYATIRLEADDTPWTCTFVDNFDGDAVDDAKWFTNRTEETGFRTGRTCYTDSPDNVAVRGGHLVLTARKGPWVKCTVRLNWLRTRFTGGMINPGEVLPDLRPLRDPGPFPATTTGGVHGGFWMFPVGRPYGDGRRPARSTSRSGGGTSPTSCSPRCTSTAATPRSTPAGTAGVADVTAFHTYTVVWLPWAITFYIDGVECFSRMPTPDSPLLAPQPFDHYFTMILNLGVLTQGLSLRTVFPAELVVDYAKAWR